MEYFNKNHSGEPDKSNIYFYSVTNMSADKYDMSRKLISNNSCNVKIRKWKPTKDLLVSSLPKYLHNFAKGLSVWMETKKQ